ncbi:MAG: ribosome silencing factor [Caldisericaceae bacterium]
MMKGKTLANFIAKIIEEKKGEDVDIIDVKKFTTLTDYFVIATSNLAEHGEAIAYEISKRLKESGNEVFAIDKGSTADWIALDCGSVIVNIMTKEKRDLYNLESLFRNLDLINKKIKANS